MNRHRVVSILVCVLLIFSQTALHAQNSVEVKPEDTPCYGAAFNSNKDCYRGSGYAESTDFSIARNKAYMLALHELSASIKSQLASVTSLYTSSESQTAAFKQEFEGVINESINETLEGVKVICQKQENLAKGKIKVYIALELNKKDLLRKIESKSAGEHHAALNFQKAKFEELFDKEMEKQK
jgi:hypothetical protein